MCCTIEEGESGPTLFNFGVDKEEEIGEGIDELLFALAKSK